jgi:hypothetical protein
MLNRRTRLTLILRTPPIFCTHYYPPYINSGSVLVKNPEEAATKGARKKKRYKSAMEIHAKKRKSEESATANKKAKKIATVKSM